MSSRSYLLYRELAPTTNVMLSTFFTPISKINSTGQDEYLLTAASSAISIYRIHRGENDTGAYLSQVYHSALYGKIGDVSTYRPPISDDGNVQEEWIVVSLDEGKYCLLKYEIYESQLKVLNIYNSEENALGIGAMVKGNTHGHAQFGGTGPNPFVTIDHKYALACSVIYGQQLFLFPLQQSVSENDSSQMMRNLTSSPFLIDLYGSLNMPGNILDICFLEGYTRPTLAVLQETAPLPIGHVLSRRHTCMLTVLAIDTVDNAAYKMWQRTNLPSDCISILQLGGNRNQKDKYNSTLSKLSGTMANPGVLIVVSMNALIALNEHNAIGLATNGFASTTVANTIELQSWVYREGVELDSSKWLIRDESTIIGSLKNGRMLAVNLIGLLDNHYNFEHLRFRTEFICATQKLSTMCTNRDQGLFFLGSASGKCNLVDISSNENTLTKRQEHHIEESILEKHSFADLKIEGEIIVEKKNDHQKESIQIKVEKQESKSDEEDAPPAKKSKTTAKKGGKRTKKAIKEEEEEKQKAEAEAEAAKEKDKQKEKEGRKRKAESDDDKLLVQQQQQSHIISPNKEDLRKEEESMYGVDISNLTSLMIKGSFTSDTSYSLRVLDSIDVIGPLLDGCFCKVDDTFDLAPSELDWAKMGQHRGPAPVGAASSYIPERELKDGLQFSAGMDKEGALVRVSQGLRFTKMAGRPFPKAADVRTTSLSGKFYSIMCVNLFSKCRVFVICEDEPTQVDTAASAANPTQSVATGSNIKIAELSGDNSPVLTNSVTISIMEIAEEMLVQVTLTSIQFIRLVDSAKDRTNKIVDPSKWKLVQTIDIRASEKEGGLACQSNDVIAYADIGDGFLSMTTKQGCIFVFQYNHDDKKPQIKIRFKRVPEITTDKVPSPVVYVHDDFKDFIPKKKCCGISLYNGIFPSAPPVQDFGITEESQQQQRSDGISSSSLLRTPAGKSNRSGDTGTPRTPGVSLTKQAQEQALQRVKEKIVDEERYLYGNALDDASSNTKIVEKDDKMEEEEEAEEEVKKSKSKAKGKKATKGKASSSKKKKDENESTITLSLKNPGDSSSSSPSLKESEVQCVSSQHLVMWFEDGSLVIIDVEASKIVFYSSAISLMPNSVFVQRYTDPNGTSSVFSDIDDAGSHLIKTCGENKISLLSQNISPASISNKRYIQDVRIANLGTNDTSINGDVLTIAIMTFTGEVVVYRLSEINHGKVPLFAQLSGNENNTYQYETPLKFLKVRHTNATRRRRNKLQYNTRKLNALLQAENPVLASAAAAQEAKKAIDNPPNPEIDENMPHHRDLEEINAFRLTYVQDIGGRNGILASGNTPLIIQNRKGLPTILPICLPEMPYSNAGLWMMAPFACGEGTHGLSCLWVEHDDGNESSKATSQGLLGFYQEIPDTVSLVGTHLSYKRIIVGKTVKSAKEFAVKGEDRLEQELLDRKTFILACSQEVQKPFESTFVTDTQRENELELKDRYFPKMKSFCQPDLNVGAAPPVPYQSDSLVLVQSGVPVSAYDLPEDEFIVAVEFLCLPTEKLQPAGFSVKNIRDIAQGPQLGKRKVFVAVATCKHDEHGEDSYGEGNLLLFGLDYSIFGKTNTSTEGGEEKAPDDETAMDLEEEARKKKAADEEYSRRIKNQIGTTTQGSLAVMNSLKQQRLVSQQEGGGAGSTHAFISLDEEEKNQIQPKLKLVARAPGPASVVKAFGDYLISTVDNTLFIYKLIPGSLHLEQIAFYTANIYIKSVSVERNFIMISDFQYSVQFLVWNQEDFSINFLGKDFNQMVSLATSFIRDHNTLGILVTDDEGNLQCLQYNPLDPDSKDGTRLLLNSDFHLGADANLLLRQSSAFSIQQQASHNGASSTNTRGSQEAVLQAAAAGHRVGYHDKVLLRQAALHTAPFASRLPKQSKRDIVVVGTLEGSVGFLSSLDERTYRRLALLQQIMITSVYTTCALNPREFRLFRSCAFRQEKKRGILDGSLLYQFVHMDSVMQDTIATAMGISADLILDSLRAIDSAAQVF
jgi:hypothetical protein